MQNNGQWMLTFGKCTDRQNLEALSFHWLPRESNVFKIACKPIPETCQRRDLLTSYICILKYRTVMEENYTENRWVKKFNNCTVNFCVKILCKVNLWTSFETNNSQRSLFPIIFFLFVYDANENILYSCASTDILNWTIWLNTKESGKLLHISKKCERDF